MPWSWPGMTCSYDITKTASPMTLLTGVCVIRLSYQPMLLCMLRDSCGLQLGKQKYHLSHHFDVLNDVSLNVGEAKPGIGGDIRSDQRLPPAYSTIPRGKGSDIPAWVAFDKQVLCFDAFFQEPVYERREEQYRVRNCKIYFYPEDDSIQVVEQRLKNTGIPQGEGLRECSSAIQQHPTG